MVACPRVDGSGRHTGPPRHIPQGCALVTLLPDELASGLKQRQSGPLALVARPFLSRTAAIFLGEFHVSAPGSPRQKIRLRNL
jgi:hypothetical protein